MKGLILKDLYTIKASAKSSLLFMMPLFIVWGFVGMTSFIPYMMSIFVSSFMINTFAYDEMYRFDSYSVTMPVSRKEIVLAKYLVSAILTVIVCVISVLTSVLISVILFFFKGDFSLIGLPEMFVSSFTIPLFILSISIPLIYKFGTQKMRIITVIVIATFMGIFFGVQGAVMGGQTSMTNQSANNDFTFIIVAIVVIAALFALIFTSYKISANIMEKKQF